MHAFFAADPAMADPDPAAMAERFATLSGRAGAMAAYRLRRPGGATYELLGDLVTDHLFLLPSLALADAVTQRGGRAFVYQFDWAAPGNRLKAGHCIELPFVFGNPAAWTGSPMLAGGDPVQMAALSATLRAAWTGFAHRSDPSARDLPWPLYGAERMTMCFGEMVGPIGDPAGVMWRTGKAA
jgi:para-nitrobenzyl esterase